MHLQTEKQIVEGDYIDTNTGLRFIEDIRGDIHFCAMLSGNHTPEPSITNNYYTTNNYTVDSPFKDKTLITLQSTIKDFTWGSTTAWNRINNSYNGGFVGYTTPIDKELFITNIIANQTKGNNNLDSSLVGLFKAGIFQISFPLVEDINFVFYEPYKIDHSTYVEFKYLPSEKKKLQFSILVMGYLV